MLTQFRLFDCAETLIPAKLTIQKYGDAELIDGVGSFSYVYRCLYDKYHRVQFLNKNIITIMYVYIITF